MWEFFHQKNIFIHTINRRQVTVCLYSCYFFLVNLTSCLDDELPIVDKGRIELN